MTYFGKLQSLDFALSPKFIFRDRPILWYLNFDQFWSPNPWLSMQISKHQYIVFVSQCYLFEVEIKERAEDGVANHFTKKQNLEIESKLSRRRKWLPITGNEVDVPKIGKNNNNRICKAMMIPSEGSAAKISLLSTKLGAIYCCFALYGYFIGFLLLANLKWYS